MKKRLVICCDGTWNRLDSESPTNVVKLARSLAYQDGSIPQLVHFDDGVGTLEADSSKGVASSVAGIYRFMGGLAGEGLLKNVETAYRFLIFNYEPGDEIFIFGFSRGAFTARSLCGLIRNCGILERRHAYRVKTALGLYRSDDPAAHPDGETALAFRANYASTHYLNDNDLNHRNIPADSLTRLKIRYLGVWDTVGALGVPKNPIGIGNASRKRHRFHDTQLSSMIENARHAVALDETRKNFAPTLWRAPRTNSSGEYLQRWFPGDHGSVGGGGDITGLSDGALLWIFEGGEKLGLAPLEQEDTPLMLADPDYCVSLRNVSADRRKARPWHKKALNGLLSWGALNEPRSKSIHSAFEIEKKRMIEAGRTEDAAALIPYEIGKTELNEIALLRWFAPAEQLYERQPYRPRTLKHLQEALQGLENMHDQWKRRFDQLTDLFKRLKPPASP